MVTSAALSCLGEYSHANNAAKRMIELYLLATGAQWQAITVLSTLGLSESYTNIVTKNVRCQRKPKLSRIAEDVQEPQGEGCKPEQVLPPQRTGTLHQLSDAMREEAREIAKTGFTLPFPHIPYGIHMEWIYSMDSTWIPYGICFTI